MAEAISARGKIKEIIDSELDKINPSCNNFNPKYVIHLEMGLDIREDKLLERVIEYRKNNGKTDPIDYILNIINPIVKIKGIGCLVPTTGNGGVAICSCEPTYNNNGKIGYE